jgi:CHAT domain-containing protein
MPGLPTDSQKHYRSTLLSKRMAQRSLQDSLRANARYFKAFDKEQPEIGISKILGQLPSNTAMLNYFLTDTAVFAVMLAHGEASFRRTQVPRGFEDSISTWVNLCRMPIEQPQANRTFSRLGHWLYVQLLAPELDRSSGVDRLLIIPDGILSSLPFEALLTAPSHGKKNLANMPYLIRKARCHYAASATLWLDQGDIPAAGNDLTCLGVAWGGEDVENLPGVRGKLNGLAGTERELEAIRKTVAGKFLVSREATEANFKHFAPDFGILHLALHARALESDPQILFPLGGNTGEDGILHFHELFPLHLNARLAVLSACETGRGKLIHGEGIQSMSSGFAAAGIPSLLMTLWEVDDVAGGEIMQGFYKAIGEGQTIDLALQNAKLAYLDAATGDKAAPYYWSAFVPMGNMQSLQLAAPANARWQWLLLAAGIPLCIFIVYRIYSKKRTST